MAYLAFCMEPLSTGPAALKLFVVDCATGARRDCVATFVPRPGGETRLYNETVLDLRVLLVSDRAAIVAGLEKFDRLPRSFLYLLRDDGQVKCLVLPKKKRVMDYYVKPDRVVIFMSTFLNEKDRHSREEGDSRFVLTTLTFSYNGTRPKRDGQLPVDWVGIRQCMLTLLAPGLNHNQFEEVSRML